jgi:hypothetical protein
MKSVMSEQKLLRIMRFVSVGLAALLCISGALAAGKTRFWNLTGETIVQFELAPTGTTNWGPDQCKNDRDDSVDDDERLDIKDVPTGSYDAHMTFKSGLVCNAASISVVEGKIFSIDDKQLKDCTPK